MGQPGMIWSGEGGILQKSHGPAGYDLEWRSRDSSEVIWASRDSSEGTWAQPGTFRRIKCAKRLHLITTLMLLFFYQSPIEALNNCKK